jgi:hypothetical protein
MFHYSVYTVGMGFNTYHCQFANERYLTLNEIEAIVHGKMEKDARSLIHKSNAKMIIKALSVRMGE